MKYLFVILLMALSAGCSSTPQQPAATFFIVTTRPAPDCIEDIWEASWPQDCADAWGKLCVERWGSGTVVVACHGFYTVAGHWLVFPQLLNSKKDETRPWIVEDLIRFEEKSHPHHTIVLLCCNLDGTIIHGFPGVFYSRHNLWIAPDSICSKLELTIRKHEEPDAIGNVDKFVEAK